MLVSMLHIDFSKMTEQIGENDFHKVGKAILDNGIVFGEYNTVGALIPSRSVATASIVGLTYALGKAQGQHEVDNILIDEIEEHFADAVSYHARCSPLVAAAPPVKDTNIDTMLVSFLFAFLGVDYANTPRMIR